MNKTTDKKQISQGAMANKNGKIFEKMMIPVFEDNAFPVLTEKKYLKNQEKYATYNRIVLKNAKYTNIYGTTGQTEFVLIDGERRIRIEAKYQSVAGSVDEKYPNMFLNAIEAYPEDEVIFVVDGGGYRAGARKWIQTAIDTDFHGYKSQYHKDFKLMTISEFMNWFNHEFG